MVVTAAVGHKMLCDTKNEGRNWGIFMVEKPLYRGFFCVIILITDEICED